MADIDLMRFDLSSSIILWIRPFETRSDTTMVHITANCSNRQNCTTSNHRTQSFHVLIADKFTKKRWAWLDVVKPCLIRATAVIKMLSDARRNLLVAGGANSPKHLSTADDV